MQHRTQSCPLLDSTLREVLRLYTSSASMRLMLEDTILNDKVLLKGNKVMIPYRALHENPDVWGSDAHFALPGCQQDPRNQAIRC